MPSDGHGGTSASQLSQTVSRQALQQGLQAGRTASFAILDDWGIGKSSLLLKFRRPGLSDVVRNAPRFHFGFQRRWRLLAPR